MISERIESVWDLLSARIQELERKLAELRDEVQDLRELVEDEWIGGTDD